MQKCTFGNKWTVKAQSSLRIRRSLIWAFTVRLQKSLDTVEYIHE